MSAIEIDNIVRSFVRAEARASVSGRRYADCSWTGFSEAASSLPVRQRVVFDESDDVARNIADRVVALALRGDLGGPPLVDITAEGVSPRELDRRIESGADEYYVASIRPVTADVCAQARRRLVAEWLAHGRIVDVGSTREQVIVSTAGIQVFQDTAGIPYVRRAQQ